MHDGGSRRDHDGRSTGLPTTAWPAHPGGPDADTRVPLRIDATATERNATTLRRALQDWLAVDVPADAAHDAALMAYEALANAVEHAYPWWLTGPRPLLLRARRTPDHVLITVADQGRWREPDPDRTSADGGRGLTLMHALSRQTHIERSDTGTTVHLTAAASSPP